MRTITVTINSGVASISVTYTNSSGTRITTSYSSSTTLQAWQGATVTWTATAQSGYEMETSSGTIAIGTADATISPTRKYATYTLYYWRNGSIPFTIHRSSSPSGKGTTGIIVDTYSSSIGSITVYEGDVLSASFHSSLAVYNSFFPYPSSPVNITVSGNVRFKSDSFYCVAAAVTDGSYSNSDSDAMVSDMTKIWYGSSVSTGFITPTSFTATAGTGTTFGYSKSRSLSGFTEYVIMAYGVSVNNEQTISALGSGTFTLKNGTVLTLNGPTTMDEGGDQCAGIDYSLSSGADNIAFMVIGENPATCVSIYQTGSATYQSIFESAYVDLVDIWHYSAGEGDMCLMMWIGTDWYDDPYGNAREAYQGLGNPSVIIKYKYTSLNDQTWTLITDNT